MNITIIRSVPVQDSRESYNTPKPAVPTDILYFAHLGKVLVTKPYWIELGNGKGEWQHRCITATSREHLTTLVIDYLRSRGILSAKLASSLVITPTNTAPRSKIAINAIFIGTGLGA